MMPSSEWATINSICERALDMPPEARSAFVERRCDGDSAMCQRVVDLLAAVETDDAFLIPPEPDRLHAQLESAESTLDAGDRIGDWEILRDIASGGMGRVYLAKRVGAPFEQLAAVKVLRGHLATPSLRERFARERQALARLQHPNITVLLDGGTTSDGTPFLVMEYVPGESITGWAMRRECSIAERLRLFLEVASAVEHAHGQLIIHRDLKPSNVIVDESGRPRLIDFGIAKLLEDEDHAEGTAAVTALRTPAYSSPEQIRGEPVSVATDVYGLGLLLYELLTGVAPWSLEGQPSYELERRICETDPLRPSAVALPEDNRRRLRGDLDAILDRALQRSPVDRYATVGQLVDDLERHLALRPIRARQESRARRVIKTLRRHRIPVMAAAAVSILLVVAGGAVVTSLFRAQDAARQATIARDDALVSIDLMQRILETADPILFANDPPLSSILKTAEAEVEALPAGQVRARLHLMLARTYRNLSQWESSARHGRAALAGFRSVDDNAAILDVAASLEVLGMAAVEVAWQRGTSYDESEALLREALVIRRRELGADHVDVARTLVPLAVAVVMNQGFRGGAEPAIALRREAIDLLKNDESQHHGLRGEAWGGLGSLYASQGRITDALAAYDMAIAQYRKSPRGHVRKRLFALAGRANLRFQTGDRAGALSDYRAVLRETPPAAARWRDVAMAWTVVQIELERDAAPPPTAELAAALRLEAELRQRDGAIEAGARWLELAELAEHDFDAAIARLAGEDMVSEWRTGPTAAIIEGLLDRDR